ncbi:sugar ABC transporter permease [Macrococcus caseolyticus]|uniref:carbohydrate ABC transporter permease n=1 Tax=Macrococcoides caseolyticum TaxID=69966 RepID=UPI0024BC69F9|nr:sugar ABC transporter permease [Macrococcus caseolyticus]MDJ1110217.1 sugar ABC transporter permease [Macrococcus caseolyticus]
MKSFNARRSNIITLLIFILPCLIPLTTFWIFPMLYSLYISFTDWDFMSEEYNMVALGNYQSILSDGQFYKVLWNTLYFVLGTTIPTLIFGLLFALLVVKKIPLGGIYRTLIFSPWITPMVAVSIVWSWIFEPKVGILNQVLGMMHLAQPGWLQSSQWAMDAVIIVTVWKGIGWAMIFYLDALKKVPKELYQAASIDGTPPFKQLMRITLPMISPTTFFLLIILAIDALQAYDQFQILTQGGPAGSTRTILYMYYQMAFEEYNMGRATALATILVVITAILSAIQFYVSKKWVHYQ